MEEFIDYYFTANIRIPKVVLEDAGLDPKQAVQNCVGFTGAQVIDVDEKIEGL